ncbi:MAG: antibiotic biosynthesis monooxygenase [Acidimicrobiales bacterium]|nr:antibiotic biosynthesis monooxygenase [Acidimicrobiales bacterium]
MSDHVYWILAATVKDGQRDEFDAVKDELIEATATEEGCLNYEWSEGPDGTIHILERFADSAAAMAHMANFGPFAKRFMTCLTVNSWTLYGSPDETVQKALSPMGAVHYSSIGGFSK